VPSSLSGPRAAPIAFHISPAYLARQRKRDCHGESRSLHFSTSRSDTMTATAIPYCYQLADKVGSPQLEARGQSFSHLTVISSLSFVLQCYLRARMPSLLSRGELSILRWRSVLGVSISYCFSLLFHFVPVIQIRLSPVLEIRSGWKILDSSFLLVCNRYRSLTYAHPIACH